MCLLLDRAMQADLALIGGVGVGHNTEVALFPYPGLLLPLVT